MKSHYCLTSLCILAMVLAPLALPSTTHAQQVEVVQVKEKSADAFWSSIDATGCIQADVFVIQTTHRERTGPGGEPLFLPDAVLSIFAFDRCKNIALRNAFGFTDQFTYDFGANLTSARLQAVIPVLDTVCNCGYDVAVDLTWTGEGDITSARSHDTITSPGMTVVTNLKGSFRAALASGTVSAVGTSDNLTPEGSPLSTIQQVQVGNVTIIRH